MRIRYINEPAELGQELVKPYAHIVVLGNGQMTLSTIDCRLDILMVYELIHRGYLRQTGPVIALTEAGREVYGDPLPQS